MCADLRKGEKLRAELLIHILDANEDGVTKEEASHVGSMHIP